LQHRYPELSNDPPPEEGLDGALLPEEGAGAGVRGTLAGALGAGSAAGAGVAGGASVAAGSAGALEACAGAAGRLGCGARTGGGATAATGSGGAELRRIGSATPAGAAVTPACDSAWAVEALLVARPIAKAAPNSTSSATAMMSARRSAGVRPLPTRAQRGSMRKVFIRSGS
jgi:hypothetical protein